MSISMQLQDLDSKINSMIESKLSEFSLSIESKVTEILSRGGLA